MNIIYRICPHASSNKPPIYKEDKLKLAEICLDSFLNAVCSKDKITFLSDGMPIEWFSKLSMYGDVIDCTGLGNVGTFRTQIELGKNMDKVLFCEDDYLWRPNTVRELEKAVVELPFVSPYDHPGHYTEPRFDHKYECKLINNIVYRSSPSNTLTFATTGKVLTALWPRMLSFGINDHEMFNSLSEMGWGIWNPTYSFATHMVDGLLAPNIDWQVYLKTPL